MNNCTKCGAPMAMSKQGKPYCSATCWLSEEDKAKTVSGTLNSATGEATGVFAEKKESKFRSHKEINAEALLRYSVKHCANSNLNLSAAADEVFLAWAKILDKLN